jgi:CBS-domain-containing membrane protein
MAFRDRSNWSDREADLDEGRFEDERARASNRRFDRGYGDDYRGYSRGYNMNREPNYATDYDRGRSGSIRQSYESFDRAPSGTSRWGSAETDRWPAREYGQGRQSGQGPTRSHLRCRDVMTRNVTTCRRDTPLTEVARLMRDEDVGAIPVIGDGGKLDGIVTDRDLVVKGLTSERQDAELKAEDCMSTDLYTANQNDRLVETIREMGDHKVRRIPVVDSRERLVGIISMADIATQTNKDMELEDALEEISQPSSFFGRLANLFNW